MFFARKLKSRYFSLKSFTGGETAIGAGELEQTTLYLERKINEKDTTLDLDKRDRQTKHNS